VGFRVLRLELQGLGFMVQGFRVRFTVTYKV